MEDQKKGMLWWKKAAFALGILMVFGAIAYSLVIRHNASTLSPVASADQPAITSGSNNPPSTDIRNFNWVKKAGVLFADNDFVFIVLPGNNEITKIMSEQIDSAVAKIKADGVNIDTIVFKPGDPELKLTAQNFAITKLPAVIAFNRGGNGALVTGDITETRLLQAYLQAVKACPPGSSPGCSQ